VEIVLSKPCFTHSLMFCMLQAFVAVVHKQPDKKVQTLPARAL